MRDRQLILLGAQLPGRAVDHEAKLGGLTRQEVGRQPGQTGHQDAQDPEDRQRRGSLIPAVSRNRRQFPAPHRKPDGLGNRVGREDLRGPRAQVTGSAVGAGFSNGDLEALVRNRAGLGQDPVQRHHDYRHAEVFRRAASGRVVVHDREKAENSLEAVGKGRRGLDHRLQRCPGLLKGRAPGRGLEAAEQHFGDLGIIGGPWQIRPGREREQRFDDAVVAGHEVRKTAGVHRGGRNLRGILRHDVCAKRPGEGEPDVEALAEFRHDRVGRAFDPAAQLHGRA